MKLFDEEVERWGGDDRHPLLWVEKVVAVEVGDVLLSSWTVQYCSLKKVVYIVGGVIKAHSCENVTDPVTFFQKMSYRGYILFRIHFKSNFFLNDWYT